MKSLTSSLLSNRAVAPMLALLLFLGPVPAGAQALFDYVDNGAALPSEAGLPNGVALKLPISISAANAAQLQTLPSLTLSLGSGAQYRYQQELASVFVNGDTSWRGSMLEAGRRHTLAVTVSPRNNILATIYTPDGKFYVSADFDETGGEYRGWLYSLSSELRLMPADFEVDPASAGVWTEQLAITAGDISIQQTMSSRNAVIGERVDVSILISNRRPTAVASDIVNILFIAEKTEFLGSDSGCKRGSTGAQPSIQCALPGLEPAESVTLDYSVRMKAEAYPQVASGVVVGDPFDPQNFVRNDSFIFVSQDTLLDTDGDDVSDFDERLLGSNPHDGAGTTDARTFTIVDLLFLYSPDFVTDLRSGSPETRINQMVATTNGYFANSGAMVQFRPVYYGQVDYQIDSLSDAMTDLAAGVGDFARVAPLREAVGADIVVLVGGLLDGDSYCGLGRTPGKGFQGELFHRRVADPELYSVLYMDGFPDGRRAGCGDDTLAHELGHNFGLDHSRRDPDARGTYDWSLGHGIDGRFATIMAYPSSYPGAESLPLFSNPQNRECLGLPCGVPREDLEQGADAVHSINQTRRQVAMRRASRLMDVTAMTGATSSLIMYGGATLSGEKENRSMFTMANNIDVRASLAIPSEHRGKMGTTYIVLQVEGMGLFYRDRGGNYMTWDGTVASLGSANSPRPLRELEELVALENFVPIRLGLNNVSITAYFAYALENEDVFVFSSKGIPLKIL